MVKKGQPKKKKRLKLRIKVLAKLIVFILIIVALFNYAQNLQIKNIYIIGNTYTKDVDIIEKAGIKDYPKISKIRRKNRKR